MVVSIFILQPLAVAVGLGLGMHPVQVMFIMISFGISVILVLPKICDMFAERSEWLQKNLKKIEKITQNPKCSENMVYILYSFHLGSWCRTLWMRNDCMALRMEECARRINHPCWMDSCGTYCPADINRYFSDYPIK